MEPLNQRLIATDANDDGVNAWTMARYAPAPELMGWVHSYCDYFERTGGFNARRELPHGNGVLIINLGDPIHLRDAQGTDHRIAASEGFVAGVHLLPAISSSMGAQAGIQVALPLTTLRRLLGVPLSELTNRVVSLDTLLGRQASAFARDLGSADTVEERLALLDAALYGRLRRSNALPTAIAFALRAIANDSSRDIATIAADIGWSRKHLAARLHDAIGIGPRAWRRLTRFQRLTKAIDLCALPQWSALAYDHGFADQAHMIREFRAFAGMTPSAYRLRLLGNGGGLVEG